MKKLALTALCTLVALAAATGAPASSPSPFHFGPVDRWTQACNDEETPVVGSCVTDPLSCAWGDEDDVADYGYGKLAAGQTVTDTLCVVTDTCSDTACPHYIDWQVTGPGNLAVTVTSSRGLRIPVAAVRSGNSYVYEGCIRDPYYTGDRNPADYPPLGAPFVLGSYGWLTSWTLALTAAKATSQATAGFEAAQNHADGSYGYRHYFGVPCPFA